MNPCDFQSEVVEETLSFFVRFVFVKRSTEKFAWDGEAFAEDQVCW